MDTRIAKFAKAFEWAVVRLTTIQAKREEPGRLLFASVTFLHPDRSLPPNMEKVDSHNLKTDATIYFRRIVMKADEAVEWYASLDKNCKTPIPSRAKDVESGLDDIKILVSPLQNDPERPVLGLPIMGTNIFSFSSARNDPAPFTGNIPSRIHRRFGNNEGFEEFLSKMDSLLFVERRMHLNLKRYPEYLGSAVLVVPDPIIKQVDNFLIPASKSKGERIFYRFIPRQGHSLDGLKITTFDEGANLLSHFETIDIPEDGILDIDKGDCSGTYGYIVTHPEHGILLYHPPSGFIRRIGLNIGIVSQVQKISVPIGESPTSPSMEYTVNRTSMSQGGMVGDEETQPSIAGRVAVATNKREKESLGDQFGQRWFGSGERRDAISFIHSLIGNAKKRVLITDPYFGVLQVPQFLFSTRHSDVEIEILTSRLAFESTFSSEDKKELQKKLDLKLIEKLDKFSEHIEQIKGAGNSEVQVKVLPGKKPILHDRFLVVDDTIWFLGNSLNTLGDRSSLIIKLPYPDEILLELEDMLSRADDFSTYKERRNKLTKENQK